MAAGKVLRPFSFDQLTQYVETPVELKRIAQDCISPLPEERPTFETIMKGVGKIKGFRSVSNPNLFTSFSIFVRINSSLVIPLRLHECSKTSNAVENLIRMMEKYTANLEQVVAERVRIHLKRNIMLKF